MYTYRHIYIYGSTTHLPSEMPLSRVSETSDFQHQLRPSGEPVTVPLSSATQQGRTLYKFL